MRPNVQMNEGDCSGMAEKRFMTVDILIEMGIGNRKTSVMLTLRYRHCAP